MNRHQRRATASQARHLRKAPMPLPSHVPPETLARLAQLESQAQLAATTAEAARLAYREAILLTFVDCEVGKGGSWNPQTGLITRRSPASETTDVPVRGDPAPPLQNGAAPEPADPAPAC